MVETGVAVDVSDESFAANEVMCGVAALLAVAVTVADVIILAVRWTLDDVTGALRCVEMFPPPPLPPPDRSAVAVLSDCWTAAKRGAVERDVTTGTEPRNLTVDDDVVVERPVTSDGKAVVVWTVFV